MDQVREYGIFGRQVGYVIVANLIILILGLIQIPVITRSLGASNYGVWSLIAVTISLALPLATLTLGTALIRFLAAEKDRDRIADDFLSVCTVVFVAGSLLSLLLIALADPLARSVFGDPEAAFYIRLASSLVLLESINMLLLDFLTMQRQIGWRAALTLSKSAAAVGLIVLFVTTGYGLTGVLVAMLVAAGLANAGGFILALRQTWLRRPTFASMKKYLRWGLPLVPNAAILWIIHTSDRYMVSFFMDTAATGIYSAAYAVGQYATFALIPLGIVLYPNVIKTYDEGHPEQAADYLKYGLKYLMMVSIPAAFGLSVLARPLLAILTTPEFAEGSRVVPLVAAGGVIFCLFQVSVYVIHVANKTHLTVRLLAFAALLNVGLNAVLIPRMGIVGAAVATLAAYGVLGLMTLGITRRYLKFDLSLAFILKSIAASAVMALCVWLIDPHSIGPVIGSIFAGAVIYFAVLTVIGGFSRYELEFFARFVRQHLRQVSPWH